MELKDYTTVIVGIALLVIATITMGMVFYVALFLVLLFTAVDYYQLRSSLSDIKNNLNYHTGLHGKEWYLGKKVTLSASIVYTGNKEHPVKVSRKMTGPIKVIQPMLNEVTLAKGVTHQLDTEIKPLKSGKVSIGPLALTRESRFFRDYIVIGGTEQIQVTAGMGTAHVHTGQSSIRVKKSTDLLRYSRADTRGGTDFYGVRPYVVGDELKNIDWARSTRTDKIIVKEFEESRLLPVFLMVDIDASMGTGHIMSQLNSAVRITTILANRLLTENTMFGLVCFSRNDIINFRPLGMGRDHIASFKTLLSGLKPVADANNTQLIPMPLSEAVSISRTLGDIEGLDVLSSIMKEAIQEQVVNMNSDGFYNAIMKASRSTRSNCQIIVMTNLSMGLGSLMNGIRMAEYYGHSVSIVLTPNIWYQDLDQIDEEKFYEKYLELKNYISSISSMRKVKVIDLYSGEKIEEIIYNNLSFGPETGLRR